MKVICDAPGQTCNRLWSYIATLSECIAKNKKMVILFYDYTIVDFPFLRECKYIYFPFYWAKWLRKGNNWNRFRSITWKLTHNDKWDWIFNFFGFIKGWDTKQNIVYEDEVKHILINLFQPGDYIKSECMNFLMPIKEVCDIVVGVHVRRGDYATWHNGRFYYTNYQYKNYLKQIRKCFDGKRISFIICSNEVIYNNDFDEEDCYFSKFSNAVNDLYLFSLCDYIIGPPSTFTRWASFIGGKPLCFIETPNQKINMDSFSPIKDFYHFANGHEIFDW